MDSFWAGLVVGIGIGSMFGALIVGTIWARHFLRTYKDQVVSQERSEDRESRLLAIMQVINKDAIKTQVDEIDQTQQIIRAASRV